MNISCKSKAAAAIKSAILEAITFAATLVELHNIRDLSRGWRKWAPRVQKGQAKDTRFWEQASERWRRGNQPKNKCEKPMAEMKRQWALGFNDTQFNQVWIRPRRVWEPRQCL